MSDVKAGAVAMSLSPGANWDYQLLIWGDHEGTLSPLAASAISALLGGFTDAQLAALLRDAEA